MERRKDRPRSIISRSGYKPKRLLPVYQGEQQREEIMTSTSTGFQRYYYSSPSGENGRSDGYFYDSDHFEARHDHSPFRNFGPSTAPHLDRRRPFREDRHPSAGPTWPPNLRPTQPEVTVGSPQWSSTGRPYVPPQQPFTEAGRNYGLDIAGQSVCSRNVWRQDSATAPCNRRVQRQGVSVPSMKSEVRHGWRSYERRDNSSPHVYTFRDALRSPSESSIELQHHRVAEQRERCSTPRHVEDVTSPRSGSDGGRRRKRRTHSSPRTDYGYIEPRNLQRWTYREDAHASRRRRHESARHLSQSGTRQRSESATRRCRDYTTQWRNDCKARSHNASGTRSQISVDFAKMERRVAGTSAAGGSVTHVRSRTGTQVHNNSRRRAHRQEREQSEATESGASAEVRRRDQSYSMVAPVRADCIARAVNNMDLFCGATSKQVSKMTDVRFLKKRDAQVALSHKSSRRLPLVAAKSQRLTSDREIAHDQAEIEPDLISAGTQVLEHASPSRENQPQGDSPGTLGVGTLCACPDSNRLVHGGGPSQFSQEPGTPGVQRPETAVLVEVVNSGDKLALKDFGDGHRYNPLQPSSYDRDTYLQVQHVSGDYGQKLPVPDPSLEKKIAGQEDEDIRTIVGVAAEPTSDSGQEVHSAGPLAPFFGPARGVEQMVNQWLQSAFSGGDNLCNMHEGDEQQNKHSSDPIADTSEDPRRSAADPTTELSFWEQETVSMASRDAPTPELCCDPETVSVSSTDAPTAKLSLEREAVFVPCTDDPTPELSSWERDTVSVASASSTDNSDVVVVCEYFPFRPMRP